MALGVKNTPAKAGVVRDAGSMLGQEDPPEEGMAPHSSTLLPGESHGQRSLAGYSPWGRNQTRLK